MTAVGLKALPWHHVDPSSVILGPAIKRKYKTLMRMNRHSFLHPFRLHVCLWLPEFVEWEAEHLLWKQLPLWAQEIDTPSVHASSGFSLQLGSGDPEASFSSAGTGSFSLPTCLCTTAARHYTASSSSCLPRSISFLFANVMIFRSSSANS